MCQSRTYFLRKAQSRAFFAGGEFPTSLADVWLQISGGSLAAGEKGSSDVQMKYA
jgi:hypothetical protein